MKLGIRSKLFLASMGVIAPSLFVADAYLLPALDEFLVTRIQHDLSVRLDLVEHDASRAPIAMNDRESWDALADELGVRARARVTIIDASGTVVGDSEVATATLEQLENHSARPEIQRALQDGRGQSTRHSTTLKGRLIYEAVPLRRDGQVAGAVRVAVPIVEVDHAIAQLRRLLLVGSVLALAVAAALSGIATHLAARTARTLTSAATAMANGDLSVRVVVLGHDEFSRLGSALNQLAANLARTLDSLRAERDLLDGILAEMNEGVLLLDAEGKLALVNPAFRDMFLLPPDAIGRPLLDVIRCAELKALLDKSSPSDTSMSSEIRIHGVRPRTLLVHASPADPRRGSQLVVVVDVTDLRRLESVRRDFVANASHELRTPVASAWAALQTLREAWRTDPVAAHEFLDIVERNIDRLNHLVEDLFDLSRIESRAWNLSSEPVLLAPIVSNVLAALADRARKKALSLRHLVPAQLAARADQRAVEQVLVNLVDNAIKYCRDEADVLVHVEERQSYVRVAVVDTGPGIEATHLPRLFERFYRVDPGRSRELGGTGLGLSIVKQLVEAMGGTVDVESKVGTGSTFSFTLPRATG